MLPTLVTIVSFLLELSCSSPVYNMQPAYITATIGSTGRNIRNLPCISRKNNQNGVCMFAIDCLKANGTHLGTCIDRFYFGSCCHIEPIHEITENTIDLALIPSRQPPSRVSTSTEKITTIKVQPTTTLKENLTKLTTIAKVTHATTTPSKTTVFVTKKPIDETTLYKLTTFQSVDGNEATTTLRPIITRPSVKPTKPAITKPQSTKPIITKPAYNVTVIYRPTQKPLIKPRPTRPTNKTTKPTIKHTNKPVRLTTIRDNLTTTPPTTIKISKKPIKTTLPPTTTTTTTTTTLPPTTTTRRRTTTTTTTTLPPTTTTRRRTTTTTTTTTTTKPTTKKEIITTLKPKITTPKPITTTPLPTTLPISTTEKLVKITAAVQDDSQQIAMTTVKTTSTSLESNELPVNMNVTSVLEAVNGNPATNEIESEKPVPLPEIPLIDLTTYPTLVTWAQVNDNYTTEAYAAASSSSEEPEGWVPLTTPDGWVLLPSLSTVTEPPPQTSTESTTSSSTPPPTTNAFTSTAKQELTSESTSALSSIESTTNSSPTSNSSSSSVETNTSNESLATSVSIEETSISSIGSTTTPTTNNGVNMTDFTDVCGRRMFPEARIVGGEKSPFGKWPWQISLRQWRTSTYLHKCGAALLNENWAITAAHCVDNVPPSDLLLRLGEHDLSTESEPYLHQERRVQIVASHPQFDPRTFEYDLALLRFYEPVQFQPNIIPVCVPQNDENFVGRTAYVTGWGRLYEDGPLPSILQEVSVPVINNTVCESMYRSAGYIEHIPNIFICAGWRRGGFDSCEGDSGGPMVIQRPDKRFLLAGVISWGIGCAEPNQPGVYTRISEFRDWINQILQF